MASTNIKIFDENKANMKSDGEYASDTQRLLGVQQGVASSSLQNKTLYQVTLVSYAIAQMMVANNIDANDSDAVSTFVNNLSSTIMQKVNDKATSQEAISGLLDTKFITPLSSKAAIDAAISLLQPDLSLANAVPRYLTFVLGAAGNQLDAAFGKNNEDRTKGVGLALAMYARFKDPDINIETTFPNLIQCDTLDDIANDSISFYELSNDDNIKALILSNSYAKSIFSLADNEPAITNAIAHELGVSETYTNIKQLLVSHPTVTETNVFNFLVNCNNILLESLATDESALITLFKRPDDVAVVNLINTTNVFSDALFVSGNTALSSALFGLSDDEFTNLGNKTNIRSILVSKSAVDTLFSINGYGSNVRGTINASECNLIYVATTCTQSGSHSIVLREGSTSGTILLSTTIGTNWFRQKNINGLYISSNSTYGGSTAVTKVLGFIRTN